MPERYYNPVDDGFVGGLSKVNQDPTPLKESGNNDEMMETIHRILDIDDQLLEIVEKVTSGEHSPTDLMVLNGNGIILSEALEQELQHLREIVRG